MGACAPGGEVSRGEGGMKRPIQYRPLTPAEKARIAAEVEAAMVELAAEKQRERERRRSERWGRYAVRGVRTDTGRRCA